MTKIFEDRKEPLFGRVTHKIVLRQFVPSVVKQILKDFNPDYTKEDLLCLYMLTGGVAKYIFMLMHAQAFTKEKMISYATNPVSPFLTDGKDLLVGEMGKEYGVYFSILQLIAGGKTSQSEIDSVILKNTGSYLQNLDKVFDVIKPIKPIFSKKSSRNARWQITDCYLRFWFKFIYANQNLVEIGEFNMLEKKILNDYDTFTGKTLERYFFDKILEKGGISKIGSWWDRKSENELDIVTVDETEKLCVVYEVKRNKDKIILPQVSEKAKVLSEAIHDMQIKVKGLSMNDM